MIKFDTRNFAKRYRFNKVKEIHSIHNIHNMRQILHRGVTGLYIQISLMSTLSNHTRHGLKMCCYWTTLCWTRKWIPVHHFSSVIEISFAISKAGIYFQYIDFKLCMLLHGEVVCIYCGKYHKCVMRRHAWINIQISEFWKMPCQNAATRTQIWRYTHVVRHAKIFFCGNWHEFCFSNTSIYCFSI